MHKGSPALHPLGGFWVEKVGASHTPAKDCVLCTPAFPLKDGDPGSQVGTVFTQGHLSHTYHCDKHFFWN